MSPLFVSSIIFSISKIIQSIADCFLTDKNLLKTYLFCFNYNNKSAVITFVSSSIFRRPYRIKVMTVNCKAICFVKIQNFKVNPGQPEVSVRYIVKSVSVTVR